VDSAARDCLVTGLGFGSAGAVALAFLTLYLRRRLSVAEGCVVGWLLTMGIFITLFLTGMIVIGLFPAVVRAERLGASDGWYFTLGYVPTYLGGVGLLTVICMLLDD